MQIKTCSREHRVVQETPICPVVCPIMSSNLSTKLTKSTILTYKCPPTSPRPHTISCTGWELRPCSQLAVILAWELAGLSEGGHGTSQFQTGQNVHLSTVLLFAGHSLKENEEEEWEKMNHIHKINIIYNIPFTLGKEWKIFRYGIKQEMDQQLCSVMLID